MAVNVRDETSVHRKRLRIGGNGVHSSFILTDSSEKKNKKKKHTFYLSYVSHFVTVNDMF